MQPNQEADYKKLLTDVIKKQILILGPDITLLKARNVEGLGVSEDGTVEIIDGNPREIIQNLADQFVQLSGFVARKTMNLLLPLDSLTSGTPTKSTPNLPENTEQETKKAKN